MKNIFRSVLVIALLFSCCIAFGKEYYSVRSGEASDMLNWNSSRDGKGASPATFNDVNDIFIIQGGHVLTGAFSCMGSLLLERNTVYTSGKQNSLSSIGTILTINEGAQVHLLNGSILTVGFVLIQGEIANKGGEIRFHPAVAAKH